MPSGALAVAAPHPPQPRAPSAGAPASRAAGLERAGAVWVAGLRGGVTASRSPLGRAWPVGGFAARLLGPFLNSARASRGGQRISGVPREPPFDLLQCHRAAGVCVSLRWFLLAFVGAGASGRWGGRGVGRKQFWGWGGLTSAMRACDSSSTRLGGLGEGPRPWVVISWGCGWGLVPRGPGHVEG